MLLGLLRGEDLKLMFLTAISLVVAALPESLPAVVTIALALGAQQMLKRRALIRNLPSVETLGSVTVICSGKTGTLTENRMTVTVLDAVGQHIDLTEQLRSCSPVVAHLERARLLSQPPALALLLTGGALCNNALVEPDSEEPHYFRTVGDPTEGAMLMAAVNQGLWKGDLEIVMPRIAELSFNTQLQRMTTIHRFPRLQSKIPCALETVWRWICTFGEMPYIAFTKGKVGHLLDVCTYVWVNGQAKPLNELWLQHISFSYHQLKAKGLRVMGVAFRPLASGYALERLEVEKDLIFIGLVGMNDPARPEVRNAVLTCKRAGIRPVMITGDHPLSARFIAREVGITTNNQIITNEQLSHISSTELADIVEDISVYAKASPANKFDIVQVLQQQGHIVAITGDGASDTPALKRANIGAAMGIRGTDVAKEAADMVLLDDNFATMVAAVKEGRRIYDNIRKFIKYIFSSNAGELLLMLLAPFLGMPLPLLPLQILWINLTTDGLPGLALGVEPAEPYIMNHPPYSPDENIFGRGLGRDIIWIGLLIGLVSLLTGYWYWRSGNPAWQTMLFCVITFSQMANVLAVRSERNSLFQIGLFSNKFLIAAVVLTLGLQIGVIYLPLGNELLKTIPLCAKDLTICFALSSIVFWGVELEKFLLYLRHRATKSVELEEEYIEEEFIPIPKHPQKTTTSLVPARR